MMNTIHGSDHRSFRLKNKGEILGGAIILYHYEHISTGAIHYHFCSESRESAFLVAFRTTPNDSSGAAHVLEHLVLSGSKKYPGRSPFFLMNGRSLNTYMNAFTSPDSTAYAFATQNVRDFENLMDVFLDLAFFPNLNKLDFLQEGCRVEFSEPDNPESPLVYKGIVLNEMKSDMSNVDSVLWSTLCSHLFKTSTYRHVSGGTPKYISDLTHGKVIDFHHKYYGPENSIFMSFGDLSIHQIHEKLHDSTFSKFGTNNECKKVVVVNEERFDSPIWVKSSYAENSARNKTNNVHFVLGWLLGESSNALERLSANLMRILLLDNSASPLRELLERDDMGESPSPLLGLQKTYKEMVFVCGLQGVRENEVSKIEAAIFEKLKQIATKGIPTADVRAAFRKLEIEQREIGGDRTPYGLQLFLKALPSAIHDVDPSENIDVEPALNQLRILCNDNSFISGLISDLLINNRHYISMVLSPDDKLTKIREHLEVEKLRVLKESMEIAETQNIVDQAHRLRQRQKEPIDPEKLPKVKLSDIDGFIPYPQPSRLRKTVNGVEYTDYLSASNGIAHQEYLLKIPSLDEHEVPLLQLYSQLLTKTGVGGEDYTVTQKRQLAHCGKFNAAILSRPVVHSKNTFEHFFALHSNTLNNCIAEASQLISMTAYNARFENREYLRAQIRHIVNTSRSKIGANGHAYAMGVASRNANALSRFKYDTVGINGIHNLVEIKEKMNENTAIDQILSRLQSIHNKVSGSPPIVLHVADIEGLDRLSEVNSQLFSGDKISQHSSLKLSPAKGGNANELWVVQENTYHCSRSWPVVPLECEDGPALGVLAKYLREGFLHKVIREHGGAYGSGAVYDTDTCSFSMFSYRDPRFEKTYDDFRRALDWMRDGKHENELLERAIIGAVRTLDKPMSPVGEARVDFHCRLFGRSPEIRRIRREKTLCVKLHDLQRVTENYLSNGNFSDGALAPMNSVNSTDQRLLNWQIRSI